MRQVGDIVNVSDTKFILSGLMCGNNICEYCKNVLCDVWIAGLAKEPTLEFYISECVIAPRVITRNKLAIWKF